jgi:hypothetical protein
MEAKPVIKNKFWIVEDQGQKIATIQAAPDGVVLVKDAKREKFVNFKLLSAKYNIHPSKPIKHLKVPRQEHSIYGFPTSSKPFNVVYDVRRRLPFYSKTSKSKSFFCAGYYAICINNEWSVHYCPKSITINRYKYAGPVTTKAEAENKINYLNNVLE